MTLAELLAIAPISILTFFSLLVLLCDALLKSSERWSFGLSILGLVLSGLFSFVMLDTSGNVFGGMVYIGGLGYFFTGLFSLAALFTIVFSRNYLHKARAEFGEYYLLILFATVGMMLMATGADLIVLFLGLELMSICLYVLAGFLRARPLSNESSLKYFLLGAFATGFLLFGIALLYGASGTTAIGDILTKYSALNSSPIFWIGCGLFLIGLAFKVGAVPFHMWVPDVYQGAPTTTSAFMATGAKAAAFSAIIVFFSHQEFSTALKLQLALAVLSAASMIIGNVIAIVQTNIKRMLAYSSIAHAGYMLAGIAAGNQTGRTGVAFYLAAYTLMNLGAFGLLALLEREEEKNLTFDDYAGLAAKHPALATLMAVFMVSLAGIPPFAGFFGKYYVFLAAVEAQMTWLAIVGVMASLVSVYYYLRLVTLMFFRPGQPELPAEITRTSIVFLSIAALALAVIGIFPSSVLSLLTILN